MLIGVDEVGRGAWAGPLVVGAVSLTTKVENLNDSKVLSAKQRNYLAEDIKQKADFIGIGWAEGSEIDGYGLSAALTLACLRALRSLPIDSKIIIDGNINFLKDYYPNSKCLIKADKTIMQVSAASIIAKVARDQYMSGLSLNFPSYGFEINVGYGTRSHIKGIQKLGICPHHRQSFKPIMSFINGSA